MVAEFVITHWFAFVCEIVFFLAIWFILRNRANDGVENFLPEQLVAREIRSIILENWRNDDNSIMRQLDRKYQ